MLSFAGCEATGDAGGTKRFAFEHVPFTFELPSDFTAETIDDANSRGDVVAGAGLTKVDVVAVRRVADPVEGGFVHRTLGHTVNSDLHRIEGFPGYALECQYTDERADDVRSACRTALESVERK